MIKDLSKSLVAAVASINQKSREQFAEEQKAVAAKKPKLPGVPAPKADPAAVAGAAAQADKNMKEEAGGTTPKTPREKKLAAMSGDKSKITMGDVMKARGVQKEEKENTAHEKSETPTQEKKEHKGTNPFDWKNYKSTIAKKPGELTGHESKKTSTGMEYTKKAVKEEAEQVEENMDTPGNSTHQCAVHVKSEQYGEGRPLFSQHAEPDAQGMIEWYDVMFAEGIKRVFTKDIEILETCNHGNHTKKKK